MSLHADESKHISFSLSQIERLCQVAKALSSPLRVKMIGLLASRSMNVNELAEALSMPVSTAALNVRQLEEAGLISTEIQPGIRGAMKLCSRRIDSVSLHLVPETQDGVSALTLKLPLGSYACAREIRPECGLVSEHAWIGESNAPRTFYHPDRFAAQLMWFESGEVEYRFSLGEIDPKQVEWLEISMEISSNAPMYREDFKSDIYVGLGARELGVWTSPRRLRRAARPLQPVVVERHLLPIRPAQNVAHRQPRLHARRRAAFKRHRRGFAARRAGIHPPAHRYSRGRGARRRHQPVRRKIRRFRAGHRRAGGLRQGGLILPPNVQNPKNFKKFQKYEISSRFVSSYQKTETNRSL